MYLHQSIPVLKRDHQQTVSFIPSVDVKSLILPAAVLLLVDVFLGLIGASTARAVLNFPISGRPIQNANTDAPITQKLSGKPVSCAAMYFSIALSRLASEIDVTLNTSASTMVTHGFA